MDYDEEIRFFLNKNTSFKNELKGEALRLDEWAIGSSGIDIAIVNGLFIDYFDAIMDQLELEWKAKGKKQDALMYGICPILKKENNNTSIRGCEGWEE